MGIPHRLLSASTALLLSRRNPRFARIAPPTLTLSLKASCLPSASVAVMSTSANAAVAFVRANTPSALAALSLGDVAMPDADQETLVRARTSARTQLYYGANTLDELVAAIPADYRSHLRAPLAAVRATAQRRVSVRATVNKWEHLKAAGKRPPHLAPKAPEVQFSKDFVETDAAKTAQEELLRKHAAYLDQLFSDALEAKKAELAALDELLGPNALYRQLARAIRGHVAHLSETRKRPVFTEEKDDAGDIVLRLSSWEADAEMARISNELNSDLPTLGFRVIALVEAVDFNLQQKKEAKGNLADQMDVDAGDDSVAKVDLAKLVDKAVANAIKKRDPLKKVRSRTHHSNRSNSSSLASKVQEGQQEFGFFFRQEEDFVFDLQQVEEGRRQRQEDAPQEEFEGEGSGAGPWEVLEGEGEGQGLSRAPSSLLDLPLPPPRFRYDIPSSWPDWILTIPYPLARSYILLNTPIAVLNANKYRSIIHRSPGVNLPKEIEYDLSIGMNYMFYSKRNSELIMEAWQDFERRLRWRIKFSFDPSSDSDDYDPDYEVSKEPSKKKPPVLPPYLELGLRAGRRFVQNTIAHIPPEDSKEIKMPSPNTARIRRYLTENNYVLTGTDKNLGIAVSRHEWLVEKSLDLLNDKKNYKVLNPVIAYQYLEKQMAHMREISTLSQNLISEPSQLFNFFRSNLPEDGEKPHIPTFYGIPKIHKQPVKMRPIIPCHSAVQNPAAKYVSKKLKPLVKAAPTIIHGTKDLAIKLSKCEFSIRKFYIVTGDVVAYYPSIDLDKCINIVIDMYIEFLTGLKVDEDFHFTQLDRDDLLLLQVFIKCLEVGNRTLITQYQKFLYLQLNGLAMGVADSPDLANLFGVHFEEQCKIASDPRIPFYGRYIDDCLAIVYADSEADALTIVSKLKIDTCTIEWQASDKRAAFLDMMLYVDQHGQLQHMPYRKSGSHQERVPWISHHPQDVKRGTFIGELSRMATLSSTYQNYKEAVESVVGLYITRGYPQHLVHSWTNSNMQERWAKRLGTPTTGAPEGVLVLKTSFNTAWNYFSAKELGDTVIGYWRDWFTNQELAHEQGRFPPMDFPQTTGDFGDLEEVDGSLKTAVKTTDGLLEIPDIRKLDIFKRRWITSRKRTRNLFDLTGLWKRTVITKLEQQTLREQADPPLLQVSQSTHVPRELEETIHTKDKDEDPFVAAWNSGFILT